MHVTLMELDGRIALKTPVGTLVFPGVAATRLATAMEEQARWSVAKASDDPDRQRHTMFPLHEIIDPDPASELGGSAPPGLGKVPRLAQDSGSDGAGGGA